MIPLWLTPIIGWLTRHLLPVLACLAFFVLGCQTDFLGRTRAYRRGYTAGLATCGKKPIWPFRGEEPAAVEDCEPTPAEPLEPTPAAR